MTRASHSGGVILRTIDNADVLPSEPLVLQPNEVVLWRVDLEALSANESRWKAILSPDELARARRFHFERDRLHFSAARALLRIVLAGYLSAQPEEVRFRYLEKGKPELEGNSAPDSIRFNVSHSGGVALFGFTRGRDIGVDIEKIRTDFDTDAIARRFFSQREQEQLAGLPRDQRHPAFFRYWALKESFIKALGEGLSHPLHQFDVTIENPVSLTTRPDGSEAALWNLRLVDVGPTHAAASAVRR